MVTFPTIDASGSFSNQTANRVSSATVTVSTTSANGLLVVCVGYESFNQGAQRNITSITATGLTFTKRRQYAPGLTNWCTVELWTAPIGTALSSVVVTVNWNANIDAAGIVAFGVNGVGSTSAPFDSSASLPATNDLNPGAAPTVSLTSAQAHDLYIGIQCGDANLSGGTAPTGWNTNAAFTNGSGLSFCGIGVFNVGVNTVQTGTTVHVTGGNAGSHTVWMVDALTADKNGTGLLAFGPHAFSAAGVHDESASGALHFGPLGMAGAAAHSEIGTGALAFGPLHMAGTGTRVETATGGLAFGPTAITAQGLEAPPAGKGKRQFWTFGA